MIEHLETMSKEAISHTKETMTTLESEHVFKRWITLDDPWEPDPSLLQSFGSLPDIDGSFSPASRRPVNCSPQLAAGITCHRQFKKPFDGPDPESVLRHLLRSCFFRNESMFNNYCSPQKLLCRSKMNIDMAFVRAVLTASQWLGPTAMPAGYIGSWPPAQT